MELETHNKLEVETFECPEVFNEINQPEVIEEAINIINNLELEGQKQLLTKTKDGEKSTRCPFRKMKKEEKFVYEVLCPQKTKLSQYNSSPVPLRVLQIAALANSFEIFAQFEVWSAKGESKDPVLVAYDTDKSNHWPYILARWADELENFGNLIKKAITKHQRDIRNDLEIIEKKVKRAFDEIETYGKDFEIRTISFYNY